MKKSIFLTLLSTVLFVAAYAQTAVKVRNNSACTVYFTLNAAPTCPATVAAATTEMQSLAPGEIVGVIVSNATWQNGGAAATGSKFISASFYGSPSCLSSGGTIGCGATTSTTINNAPSCSTCATITGTYSEAQQTITFN